MVGSLTGAVSSQSVTEEFEADLHEWRNDGHTVSSRDSVKLKLR